MHMNKALKCYLRKHRLSNHLTQRETAMLANLNGRQVVSHYELLVRRPNIHALVAFRIIFGVPAFQLFPGLYHEIGRTTLQCIDELLRLHPDMDDDKRAFLLAARRRAIDPYKRL